MVKVAVFNNQHRLELETYHVSVILTYVNYAAVL